MEIVYKENTCYITGLYGFDAAQTLDCGQAFRWRPCGEGWQGVAFGRALYVKTFSGGCALWPCTPEDFAQTWRGYFDLDRDYRALHARLSCNQAVQAGIAFAPGLRILKQEPFETLITFILSANNHFGRIRASVEAISARAGEEIAPGVFAFPRPAALAALPEDALRACGAGYRAPYIRQTAGLVADGMDLESLRTAGYAEARKALCALPGVGPKVADCVLLFALGYDCAFPVDTWIHKTLTALYPDCTRRQAEALAREQFGEYAGFANHYLFYHARSQKAFGERNPSANARKPAKKG